MLNGGGGRRARWGLVVQPDEFIKHKEKGGKRNDKISSACTGGKRFIFLFGGDGTAAFDLLRPLNKLNLLIFGF